MPVFSGQNRDQLRQMYLDAWRKYTARQPLEPLQAQVAAVIAEHPEYIPLLESGPQALATEYTAEGGRENPFLHMGLHLAIREQVATNRPAGSRRSTNPSPSAWAMPTPPSTPCWKRWQKHCGKPSAPAERPTSNTTSSGYAPYEPAQAAASATSSPSPGVALSAANSSLLHSRAIRPLRSSDARSE